MKLDIRLFAVARQLAGAEHVAVELAEGATIADLRHVLADQFPALSPLLPQMLFAVGNDYVPDNFRLAPGADLACIPPVSGG
jgi:molybdopterin converting factor small subunit